MTDAPAPAQPTTRTTRLLTWGTTGTLLALAVLFTIIGATTTEPPLTTAPRKLPNVETITVRAREYFESLTLPAKLEADRRAVLSSELNGRLDRWLVKEGEQVEAGQVLALLNTDSYQAELVQKKAEHASSQKSVTVAQQQLENARVNLTQAEKDAAALQLDLQSAQANLVLAQKEYDRIKTLSDQDIATASDVDSARNTLTQMHLAVEKVEDSMARARVAVNSAQVRVAEATAARDLSQGKVAEAQAGIAMLQVIIGKASLRAPIPGKLEEHLVEPGEVITAGAPLAHIYDLAHVRATVDVPDRYVPFLDRTNPAISAYITQTLPGARQDLKAMIVLPGMPKLTGGTYEGLHLEATIHRIAQASDPASNTFQVELKLPNPQGVLKEGMIASARIDYLRYPAAITVPLRAVVVADAGPRVLVIENRNGTDTVVVKDIEPLSIQEDQILVRRGLAEADRLVIKGGKGVINGEAVTVIVEDGILKDDVRKETVSLSPKPEL